MIHLNTGCRKIATVILALLIVVSTTNLESANSQENSVLELKGLAATGQTLTPDQSANQKAIPAPTETTYSVLDARVAKNNQQAGDDQPAVKPVPPPSPEDDADANGESFLPQETENTEDPNLDVMMRGPLHEAFAEVYQHDARPSPTIKLEPPEAVEELPPEFKPDGENVQWIPGYWAWEEERDDFLWISGIWRDVPPGQRWIPGYWQSLDGGFRWVSGFWTGEEAEEVDYTPQPPASIDNGPSYAAPSDEHYYVPGNWVYQNNLFAWQAGYWAPRRANWIYVPSRYIWTPNGCVYRAAYWDYEVARRGVVFAPVCFRSPVYRTVNYRYTPNCVININHDFLVHLFVRPTYNHYYFGDWYDSRYLYRDIYSWSSYHRTPYQRRAYDPLYSYYGCRSSRYQNVQLLTYVRNQHSYYYRNSNYRPRHTFQAQVNYSRQSYGHHQHHVEAVRRATYAENYRTHVHRQGNKNSFASTKYQQLARHDRVKHAEATIPMRDLSRRRQTQARHNHDQPNKHHSKLVIRDAKHDSQRQNDQVRGRARNSQGELDRGKNERQPVARTRGQNKQNIAKARKTEQLNGERPNRGRQSEIGKTARSKERAAQESLAQQAKQQQRESQRRGDQQRQKRVAEQSRRSNDRTQTKLSRDQQAQRKEAQNQAEQRLTNQRQQQRKLAEQQLQSTRAADARRKQLETQLGRKQDSQNRVAPKPVRTQQTNQRKFAESDQRKRQQSQRDAEKLAKQQQDNQAKIQEQREALRLAQQNRQTEQQSKQFREAQQRVAKQRTAQRNAEELTRRQREAQQRSQQAESRRHADQQNANRKSQQGAQMESRLRDQQLAQKQTQRTAQNRAQQDAQKRAQQDAQNRTKQAAQKRAQQDAANRSQQAAQKRAQQDAQKRAQQSQRQRDAQLKNQQLEAQKRTQQQRDSQRKAQQQRDAQQQAQRQREAQQRSQRETQKRAQREAQQRAQREAQQRAQREAQQRAQRESQQRAQRNAERQRKQAQRSKKNGK